MGHDPAFLFYPGDWLGGTMTFTRHHKGAYMDVLMAQFNSGHLSENQIAIVLGESDFRDVWPLLKPKFKLDSDGLFYNEKLEMEMIKRRNYTEGRRKNLQSDMKPHMDDPMKAHMENGNGNKDRDSNEFEKERVLGKGKEDKVNIPEYFKEIWPAYLEMRNKKKKPATEFAQQLIIKKLEKLYPNNPNKQIECLNVSIINSWTDVYLLKNESEIEEKNKPKNLPKETWKVDPSWNHKDTEGHPTELYYDPYADPQKLIDYKIYDETDFVFAYCPICDKRYTVQPKNLPLNLKMISDVYLKLKSEIKED